MRSLVSLNKRLRQKTEVAKETDATLQAQRTLMDGESRAPTLTPLAYRLDRQHVEER